MARGTGHGAQSLESEAVRLRENSVVKKIFKYENKSSKDIR